MSQIIPNTKNYNNTELEQIFFRPMLVGPTAVELGIKIMYNMPTPTTLNFWKQNNNVLKQYAKGWAGGANANKFQKNIELSKVKAEMGYAASDYFSMVYEKIVGMEDVNLSDLTGTELEKAETQLFMKAIEESIRTTMWVGDKTRTNGLYDTFDGLLKKIKTDCEATSGETIQKIEMMDMTIAGNAEKLLKKLYDNAKNELKIMKNDGQLVFMVTRDVYENYEESLMNGNLESVRTAKINGIDVLMYRGIQVVDMMIEQQIQQVGDMPSSWAIMTDRRNMAVAVNTRDFPGAQVAMWYNPDELENRQRAVFMAGCEYLLPELIVASYNTVGA